MTLFVHVFNLYFLYTVLGSSVMGSLKTVAYNSNKTLFITMFITMSLSIP